MPTPLPAVRAELTHTLLRLVANGHCAAIYGLSNTGKSPLLRSLASDVNQRRLAELTGRASALIYIDCNRVVELSATGFYEIVVRALLEFIEDPATPPEPQPVLLQHLREAHARIIGGPAFQASLAFNSALSESCSRLGLSLVLLLDEFDEVYASLEERTLLNLRALKDHARDRLAYITATARPLAECRASSETEFAELFAVNTLPLGLLPGDDARAVVRAQGSSALPAELEALVLRLAGGHLGLLTALTEAVVRGAGAGTLPPGPDGTRQLASDPAARAECLKLWNSLRPEEHAALTALATAPEEALHAPALVSLQALGLVVPASDPAGAPRWRLFSELFENFVRRQSAMPAHGGQGVLVDDDAGEVWVDGARVTILTDLEYRLMRLLYERRDRLTTKDMIVEAVWGGDYLDRVDDARIEKLVSRLRAKIEPDPARPRYLQTQRGRGYRLSRQPMAPRGDEDDAE